MEPHDQKFTRYVEMALTTASQAAEDVINQISRDPSQSLESCEEVNEAYLKVDSSCEFVKFIKDHGQISFEPGLVLYSLGNEVTLVRVNANDEHRLIFLYAFHERRERPVVEASMNAACHVLSQVQPGLEIQINTAGTEV